MKDKVRWFSWDNFLSQMEAFFKKLCKRSCQPNPMRWHGLERKKSFWYDFYDMIFVWLPFLSSNWLPIKEMHASRKGEWKLLTEKVWDVLVLYDKDVKSYQNILNIAWDKLVESLMFSFCFLLLLFVTVQFLKCWFLLSLLCIC